MRYSLWPGVLAHTPTRETRKLMTSETVHHAANIIPYRMVLPENFVCPDPESRADGMLQARDTLNKSGEDFLVVVGGVSRKSPASGAVSSDVPPSHFAPAAPLRPLTGPAGGPRTGLGPLRPRHPVS